MAKKKPSRKSLASPNSTPPKVTTPLATAAARKKTSSTADAEFTKSLDSHPKSANLIYDIGDYAMKHSQPDRLVAVANKGEKIAPKDPRGKFYRAVALILKEDNSPQPETLAP